MNKIAIIGTGYVGLVTGLGFAKLGHRVHFVDIDKDTLNIDHQAIIGHGITLKENSDIFVLYKKHCELLYKLK